MSDNINYIYLLQEREFIKTKENVYKIGMTRQNNLMRFKQYPNGSKLLLQTTCNDCKKIESQIIKIFKEKFKQRKDIGNEYFEGNYNEMKNIINNIVEKEEEPEKQYNQQFYNLASEALPLPPNTPDTSKHNGSSLSFNLDSSPLENLVRIIYCSNKYNQFKNIIVTDMDSKYIYKYDENTGIFIFSDKEETLNILINNLLQTLEEIYNEAKDELTNNRKSYITNFINKIKFENEIYIDVYGKQYNNYKNYEMYKIEKILFENKDKIINNIYKFIENIP